MEDTISVYVENGAPLPELGWIVPVKSAMTGAHYELKVSQIKSLKWMQDGGLLVEVKGVKKRVEMIH